MAGCILLIVPSGIETYFQANRPYYAEHLLIVPSGIETIRQRGERRLQASF